MDRKGFFPAGLSLVIIHIAMLSLFAQTTSNGDGLSINRNILADKIAFYERNGYKTLYGKVPIATIDNKKCVVIDSLIIGPADTITIEKNSTLFFEDNAVIVIKGVLISRGTDSKPVTFTPLPSEKFYLPPAVSATTWRGIAVENHAGLQLHHTKISGSSQGIMVSEECAFVHFTCVVFDTTNRNQLMLNDKPLFFKNHRCIDYSFANTLSQTAQTPNTPLIPSRTAPRRTGASGKITAIVISGALSIGCFTGGTIMHLKAKDLDKQAAETMSPDAQTYWDQRNEKIKHRNILWSAAAASSVLGLSFTFLIPSPQEQ